MRRVIKTNSKEPLFCQTRFNKRFIILSDDAEVTRDFLKAHAVNNVDNGSVFKIHVIKRKAILKTKLKKKKSPLSPPHEDDKSLIETRLANNGSFDSPAYYKNK